jgi:hypothetical protein
MARDSGASNKVQCEPPRCPDAGTASPLPKRDKVLDLGGGGASSPVVASVRSTGAFCWTRGVLNARLSLICPDAKEANRQVTEVAKQSFETRHATRQVSKLLSRAALALLQGAERLRPATLNLL